MDFTNTWKSSHCSVEFQSNVGAMRRVEGLGASAFKALVRSVIAAGSPMTAKVQTRTTCADNVGAGQGCLKWDCGGCHKNNWRTACYAV